MSSLCVIISAGSCDHCQLQTQSVSGGVIAGYVLLVILNFGLVIIICVSLVMVVCHTLSIVVPAFII